MINDVQVAGKKGMVKAETQPSAHGIRIEPRIDEELKQKVERLRDLSTNFNISLPICLSLSFTLSGCKGCTSEGAQGWKRGS